MATRQSFSAYMAAYLSGNIESFHQLLFTMLKKHGPQSSMTLSRILEDEGQDLSEIRNVATALSAMEVNGLINLDETRSIVDGFTGRESAVYYVPEVAPTESEVLHRKLRRAAYRYRQAEKEILRINGELEALKRKEAA